MTQQVSTASFNHPKTQAALSAIQALVGCYLAVSLATIGVLALYRNHPAVATQNAWVHAIIVACTASLMALFAGRTASGQAQAYLRLRIASAVMLVAIVIISAVPGDFPSWMKLEGGLCGLLLLGVVIVANSARLRSAFNGK